MNRRRRADLDRAIEQLERAKYIVELASSEESDCLSNMPENLEGSQRYEDMETAVDCLEDAIGSIDEAIEKIEEAKGE